MCSFKRQPNQNNHHYYIIIVFIERRHPKLNTLTGMKKSIPSTANELINIPTATSTTTITTSSRTTGFSPPTPLIPIIPNVEGPYLAVAGSASEIIPTNTDLNQSTTTLAGAAAATASLNGTAIGDEEINSFYFYEVSILFFCWSESWGADSHKGLWVSICVHFGKMVGNNLDVILF